jgi:hypothetical protein
MRVRIRHGAGLGDEGDNRHVRGEFGADERYAVVHTPAQPVFTDAEWSSAISPTIPFDIAGYFQGP